MAARMSLSTSVLESSNLIPVSPIAATSTIHEEAEDITRYPDNNIACDTVSSSGNSTTGVVEHSRTTLSVPGNSDTPENFPSNNRSDSDRKDISYNSNYNNLSLGSCTPTSAATSFSQQLTVSLNDNTYETAKSIEEAVDKGIFNEGRVVDNQLHSRDISKDKSFDITRNDLDSFRRQAPSKMPSIPSIQGTSTTDIDGIVPSMTSGVEDSIHRNECHYICGNGDDTSMKTATFIGDVYSVDPSAVSVASSRSIPYIGDVHSVDPSASMSLQSLESSIRRNQTTVSTTTTNGRALGESVSECVPMKSITTEKLFIITTTSESTTQYEPAAAVVTPDSNTGIGSSTSMFDPLVDVPRDYNRIRRSSIGSTHSNGPSVSIYNGDDVDITSSARSERKKAEGLRARLRNQEQRLAELMQSRRSNGGGLGGAAVVPLEESREMKDVKETLKQVEAEKADLEQKLAVLQQRQAEQEAERQRLEQDHVHDGESQSKSQDVRPKNNFTLEQALEISNEHDAFVRDKIATIQRGFHEQATRIETLVDTIRAKDADINMLQYHLSTKLKQIIELQYDLHSHDIHYTQYSKQQFELGSAAMNEINEIMEHQAKNVQQLNRNDCEEDDMSSSSSLSLSTFQVALPPANGDVQAVPAVKPSKQKSISVTPSGRSSSLQPIRAKKLISHLLSDLDRLEEMYKSEKLNAMEMKAKLKRENDELRAMVHILERQAEERKPRFGRNYGSSKGEEDPVIHHVEDLRKRIDKLEAIRFLYHKDILHYQDEIERLRNESIVRDNQHQAEIARLTVDLEALQSRCKTLETDLFDEDSTGAPVEYDYNHNDDVSEYSSIGPQYPKSINVTCKSNNDHAIDRCPSKANSPSNTSSRPRSFHKMQQRLSDYYQQISRLEADSAIKDKQISALKRELHRFRVQCVAINGQAGVDEKYNELEVSILSNIDNKTEQMRTLVYSDLAFRREKISLDGTESTSHEDMSMTDANLTCNSNSSYNNQNIDDSFILMFDNNISNVNDDNRNSLNLSKHSASLNTYIADLKRQLDEVRNELRDKDQELTIEKARSSCMAANLLERIDRLDKQLLIEEDEEEFDDDEERNLPNGNNTGQCHGLTDNDHEKPKEIQTEKQQRRKRIFPRVPLRFYL